MCSRFYAARKGGFVIGRGLGLGLLLALALAITAKRAWAFAGFDGARVLGMGGASRGYATGGAGPLLNPSGMSLVQLYHIDAGWVYAAPGANNFFHASVVDSTSGFKLGGGLYYTYHTDNPDGPASM